MKRKRETKPKWIKPAIIVAGTIAVVVGLRALGVTDYLSKENIGQLKGTMDSMGIWGPVAYIGLYIVGTLFFLPGLVLTLVAGAFGAVMGTVYVSIASTVGASLAFLLARYALRPMVESWAADNDAFRKIDDGVQEHGWRMVMLTRLVPLFPFNLQNYAYGLTKVPFWTYVLVSWVCMLPGTMAYVVASGSIISGEGDVGKTLVYLGIAAVLFVGLSFVPRMLNRRFGPESM